MGQKLDNKCGQELNQKRALEKHLKMGQKSIKNPSQSH